MKIKAWREVAKPHSDVLEGTFKQSEFAADISQVASGIAPEEYQDAEKFFSRTFITEGMRLLLISVVQRLTGQGGDPVIQLQTAFGGGKTHTMLTVFHLAKQGSSTKKLLGIPTILDEAGIAELPNTNIAVIDGIKHSPSQAIIHDDITVNTLWGELAWQLQGKSGYAKVSQSDIDGTSPGKNVLVELLKEAAPCVILIDEMVAFVRQFESGKQYKGGTFDSNISFIQALTEALKLVPNAILLASLPESELEAGGETGKRALNSLEKYFARVESVWKPVAAEESFEIVRRRLFDSAGDSKEIRKICKSFANYYKEHGDKLPPETQSEQYEERMYQSYPIHPEIFDRLYNDWSTLDKFQRTRGVLQYMAIIIHRLWNSENKDTMIMPGSIPLEDGNVRNKSIHYLPQGWEPIIEKEIDGSNSETMHIDGHDTRFGAVQAARRVARTIFLGSAPSTSDQTTRGIEISRTLLGSIEPGHSIAVFEDVLNRLRDRLHYLYSNKDHFWFDIRPNLRREMEGRKKNFSKEDVDEVLKKRVNRIIGQNHCFSGIHVFTPSADIPDDYGIGPRLVILTPSSSINKDRDNLAIQSATEILRNRGKQPRQKQNRLIFIAPDDDCVSRLKDQTRAYLAWNSILEDFQSDRLVYQSNQLSEVKRTVEGAEQALIHILRETYKWILAPIEELGDGKPTMRWESVAISNVTQNLVQTIENKLYEEEWIVQSWSPIHLRNILNDLYFKDGSGEISALKFYQDCCQYLYLPRLINDHVLKNAISKGVETKDFFGYANAKEENKYLGFVFGRNAMINIDEFSILINIERALEYEKEITHNNGEQPDHPGKQPDHPGKQPDHPGKQPDHPGKQPDLLNNKKHFYGSVKLDSVKSKMEFSNIVDEVIQQFSSELGVDVNISVEIEANSGKGFDENKQRTIKENCNVLKFDNAEFEDS
jgi:uncharacterized protein